MSSLGAPAYAFSKAALNSATRALARTARARDARAAIVAVCPGDVDTEMLRGAALVTPSSALGAAAGGGDGEEDRRGGEDAAVGRLDGDDEDDGGSGGDSWAVLSPTEAARDVAWLVDEAFERPREAHGRFFRCREVIDW